MSELPYLKKIKNSNYVINKTHLSSVFISEQKLHYTFSFPVDKEDKQDKKTIFKCKFSWYSCPDIDEAPDGCPVGYEEVREEKKCELSCRDSVGNTTRCPCDDWMSCAAKERYTEGCGFGYESSFRVRECSQGLFAI